MVAALSFRFFFSCIAQVVRRRMSLQIHSNYFCLPLQRGCLVSSHDKNENSWENISFIQCGNLSSSDNLRVQCCSFSQCGKYLAICLTRDLIIYNTDNWNFLCSTKTDRKGVSVKFLTRSNIIFLAEKSGSVKFFNFFENRLEKSDIAMGHNAMLIDALVSEDEDFIITCDRDEKIRITNYPNVYNIQCYCLGHTQFVCSMNFLESDKNILISSSGDGTIRFWEITTGKELMKYSGNASEKNIKFFIKIVSNKIGKDQSLVAALENKFDSVTILKVTGNVTCNLNIELLIIIKSTDVFHDVEFWQGNLICVGQDKNYPIKEYNYKNNFQENTEPYKKLSGKLMDIWDLLIMTCKEKVDLFPLFFQCKKDNEIPEVNVKKKKVINN